MEFLLLGPLEVRNGAGPVPIGGPKQRTVLALLLIEANRVVGVDRLIDAVWATEPPETARNTLQTYVRHLRKALGAERIEHRPSGYVLIADPDEVDSLRFRALVDDARRLESSDPPRAAAVLHEATALWRGSALSDLAEQPALQPEIARLEEARLAATEDQIAADLALGRHRDLVPELEILVGRHPFRERLWGHLMVALYRSGRQGDALAAYRRARSTLVEQLGIDPSPELQHLEQRVLRQDPELELGGKPLRGYRLIERIGEGPFGVVHRARQPQVGREVAIKSVHRELANDPEFVRRFEPEARAVARLEHAHIVPLHDFWRDPDGAYLVTRFLPSGSLRDLIERSGPLPADEAAPILVQVAHALAAAHRQSVVHGDVKPENILLDEDGDAYLSDFAVGAEPSVSRAKRSGARGAIAYLSPERSGGEPATPAADVYALGVVTYEALTGRHPFPDGSLASLVERHLHDPVPSILDVRPDLPPAVDEVVARATAKDPTLRFADAPSLAAALREALGEPVVAPSRAVGLEVANPYKGLRAFDESDAEDFFGRERMTERLATRLAEEVEVSRLLAVVGPSGSGKSSLVRAGLVPALRRGVFPGSDAWFTTELVPGPHPFEALEVALLRVAIDHPADLAELLERDERGLLRAVRRILPADGRTELLLVVDQLEELFTHTSSDAERSAFLASIVEATMDPGSQLRVVVVLRADFYDRPLLDPRFGPLLGARTEAITPLVPDEIERAIAGPAERVGVSLEPALVADMVADVADQPGALPLLQYTLTELFERRRDRTMTLEAYREIGGVSGALAGRAEELFLGLDADGREACRQLFLRLVALGEGTEDTRRRVPRFELDALEVERGSMEAAIEAFGRHRLLSFDRDESTRGPTVELAHEALIRAWGRLREWIGEGREDMRAHRRLASSAEEWAASGRDPSFLVSGARLERLASWASETRVALDRGEREFVEESLERHEAEVEAERTRVEHERSIERRSIRRMRALIAVLAAAALVASGLTWIAVDRSREAERRRIQALLSAEREMAGRLTAASVASLQTDPELSLRLALHSVDVMATLGEPVPAATVEALHWGLQEAGVQYPVEDGPVAVAGPLGTRGVYDLPLLELLDLAREHAAPTLAREQCDQYFGRDVCPSLPEVFPQDLSAEPIRAVTPIDPGQPLAGTEVTVFNTIDARRGLLAELDRFTERTGIRVRLVGVNDVPEWVYESVAAGDPPDIAYFPQPGEVVWFGQRGHLIDLAAYVDIERLRADQSPYLVSLGTIGSDGSWPSPEGSTYGAFVGLNLKSLVWYPVPELRDAGYAIPEAWDELLALGDELAAEGRTPWCLGLASGGGPGWPGTDWIEILILKGAGPDAFDRWTSHEVGFEDPAVRLAFERFGEVVFPEGNVYLDPEGALDTFHGLAQLPMVEADPPRCWLYQYPTFAVSFLPWGSVGTETDAFTFPAPTERFREAALGGGDLMGAFADRPEVRELVRFLLSPEYGEAWAELGRYSGFLSPNRRFALEHYQPWWRRQAELVNDALASDTFRFDGSDLMPPRIAGLFNRAMQTYLAEGPGSVDRILTQLEEAWTRLEAG